MKRTREDDDTVSKDSTPVATIKCTIPPCHVNLVQFDSYLAYEAHVITFHNHVCQQCRRRFPSNQFLEIHIDENHNPFWQLARDKGEKVFSCFQYGDGCNKKCGDRKKRRLHMIDKHGYPRDFNFGIVDYGLES